MPASNRSGSAPVKFTFRNIGPVRNADMELGDLTIVAGRNNTGKTYLVYTLYGFLSLWDAWPVSVDRSVSETEPAAPRASARRPIVERIVEQVMERGRASVDVSSDGLASERKSLMRALARSFSREALSGVFSSSTDAFKGASIGVDFRDELPGDLRRVELHTRSHGTLAIAYDGNSVVVTTAGENPPDRNDPDIYTLPHHVTRLCFRFLFPELSSDLFVLSAERFGISLFYRELDFTKNQLVDVLQKMGDRKRKDNYLPFVVLDQAVSRYALPIKHNIDYTRSVSDLRRRRSELYDEGLFKDIKGFMGGYYKASSDTIEFHSTTRGDGRFAIPLHLASSSARGLSDLYFFLRHVARRDHLVIIDEPEGHLDTANQVLLARLLIRMVRSGLKVLLTTHSDYLVKEINNLIMLNGTFAHKPQVLKKLKYDENDFIEPERIRAYVAKDHELRKCEIDEYGIDMPNFDETIDSLNNTANELASRLKEAAE